MSRSTSGGRGGRGRRPGPRSRPGGARRRGSRPAGRASSRGLGSIGIRRDRRATPRGSWPLASSRVPLLAPGYGTPYYRLPLARLWVTQSIWQFSAELPPPLLHAEAWSASISANLHILVLLAAW